jgi:hypothetical protein
MSPLSPAATVALLRLKYPEAIACSVCAVLLATRRESYAQSNDGRGITEAERLAYVCAECRRDDGEAVRIKGVMAARGERLRDWKAQQVAA